MLTAAREGIARTVVHEVILHRWPQAQCFSPSTLGEDDIFGKTAERWLLVQPGCGHAAAKLRASQRLLRQQLETAGDAPQHVLLRPFGQEQVFGNPVRDLSDPLIEVRHARLDADRHTRLVHLHHIIVRQLVARLEQSNGVEAITVDGCSDSLASMRERRQSNGHNAGRSSFDRAGTATNRPEPARHSIGTRRSRRKARRRPRLRVRP